MSYENLISENWRLAIKALPFIISLVFTIVIYFIADNIVPAAGNVTTDLIAVWL